MTDREWLDSLKPGDVVLISGNHTTYNEAPDTTTGRVLRVLKNHIVLVHKNSTKDSGPVHRSTLIQPTPEAVAAHNAAWTRFKLMRRVKAIDWTTQPDSVLVRVIETIGAQQP